VADDPALEGLRSTLGVEQQQQRAVEQVGRCDEARHFFRTQHDGQLLWGLKQRQIIEVKKDGLGLMWLRPAYTGPCDVLLNHDNSWEVRLCRWVSWAALSGAVIVLVARRLIQPPAQPA